MISNSMSVEYCADVLCVRNKLDWSQHRTLRYATVDHDRTKLYSVHKVIDGPIWQVLLDPRQQGCRKHRNAAEARRVVCHGRPYRTWCWGIVTLGQRFAYCWQRWQCRCERKNCCFGGVAMTMEWLMDRKQSISLWVTDESNGSNTFQQFEIKLRLEIGR